MPKNIKFEAKAFNDRLKERVKNGFVADLDRIPPNDYFYKSFWRHPHYVNLYLGEMKRQYIRYFTDYLPAEGRILDMGCGPGFFALELARSGYTVVGMDISEYSIEIARRTLDLAAKNELTGTLEYHVGSYEQALAMGPFDGILSSGFLHHIPKLDEAVDAMAGTLTPNGILVMHEPQHRKWTQTDAALVATIRTVINHFGAWYDEEFPGLASPSDVRTLVNETFIEYVLERDPSEEGGQSPNDLSADRDEILSSLERRFDICLTQPSFSFIYRLIGGLRGDQGEINRLADLLTMIDQTLVSSGTINANYFFGVARKRTTQRPAFDQAVNL